MPGVMTPNAIATETTTATAAVVARRPGAQSRSAASSAKAVTTLIAARTATAIGEPTSGMTTNGIANVAAIAPTVFAARSLPVFDATWPGMSARSVDEAGSVKPMTTVVGATTNRTGPAIATADATTRDGSSGPGWPMTRTRLPNARAATVSWATAIAPIGRPIRG